MATITQTNNLSNRTDHSTFCLANDPNTAPEVLARLSKSDDEVIRGAVAYNKSTPDETIAQLLEDTSSHVLSVLRKRGIRVPPRFFKPSKVIGNNLIFRNASEEDASFILDLRTDKSKSQHLSATPNDLSKQIAWLERYKNDTNQIYFIITDRVGDRVGTVRLYDQKGDSFCWGSWILKHGAPNSYSVESALIVYHYALSLGFEKAHFDVRKPNESVWKFHERFGAIRVGETYLDYLYTIQTKEIEQSLLKYQKYLPNGIGIQD